MMGMMRILWRNLLFLKIFFKSYEIDYKKILYGLEYLFYLIYFLI